MSMAAPAETGVEGFIAGLQRCGTKAVLDNGVVRFTVTAVMGAYAGEEIETGVGSDELGGWPAVPPHWVHLPAHVAFSKTNSQPSPIPGWTKHSRDIKGWGNAKEPAQAWIGHVRAVLAETQ